jgi:hypothetical protein
VKRHNKKGFIFCRLIFFSRFKMDFSNGGSNGDKNDKNQNCTEGQSSGSQTEIQLEG